ncbi:MAG TPA: hypothetical protein VHR72_14940, partial [Gemmataceae bacterium]|nr:hypothetical protein [Gemmataceae bacterium]
AQPPADLAKRPIATAKSPVGDLLRKWHADGTAAGNVGDWYDNRDGGHSDLDTAPYPQLQRVVYSDDDKKAKRHWAMARVVRPEITFGNSSTSAPPLQGGSNPRSYYVSPGGLKFLYTQYTHNNVYIYPEHRDHDPGHNGPSEGFGDLYPTNTPYLFISQGSSGSDQPWMRAIPYVLAAFRPEVKAKLKESGLLMPTVQMLFRRTSKRLKSPDEYFTYKAHPTVFEGSWVDDLALVKAAHDITLGTIPPMVQMKVVAEDEFQFGKDYFDPGTEKLADTPCVIARIWRAAAGVRRMTVSAEASFDANRRPLTYMWVVLRGDADKIKIKPKNKEGSVVELTVPYHDRRPIYPGAELESNRVDIGVFVDNGVYPSAPGFVTFHTLDSEGRLYDDQGRIREIGYGAGEVVCKVTDWSKWIAAAQEPVAAELLRLTDAERKLLVDVTPKLNAFAAELKSARESQKEAESRRQKAIEGAKKDPTLEGARKKAEADVQAAQKTTQARMKDFDEILDAHYEPMPLRRLAEKRVREAARSSDLEKRLLDTKQWVHASVDSRGAIESARQTYARLGFDVTVEPASAFDGTERERYLALALTRVLFPGSLTAEFRPNYVDRRETAAKFWRDVYRYDAGGGLLGWTRHDGKTATEYGAQGCIVEKKDVLGRCIEGRGVEYRVVPGKGPAAGTIQPIVTDVVVMIRYADDTDRVGMSEMK